MYLKAFIGRKYRNPFSVIRVKVCNSPHDVSGRAVLRGLSRQNLVRAVGVSVFVDVEGKALDACNERELCVSQGRSATAATGKRHKAISI